MKDILIKALNLSYKYNDDGHALDNLSVEINRGERVVVLGPNGAGKSTFFLTLNGVLRPNNGQVYYKGKEVAYNRRDLRELRKNVGIVFQDADNQILASTVQGEVSFGPMNLKLSKEEVINRVDEALEYMNLKDYKNRPPHYLSGGEKKRVSIADIIAMKPEIIIFDEPTASLDPVNSQMLEEVLDKLTKDNMTLLISTHDVDFAFRWAERVLVFCEGRIIADGSPVGIFKDDEILRKANLKKPTLLEVYDILVSKGVLNEESEIPREINELKKILDN